MRKARGTIYTFVKEVIADSVITAVNDGFDVETAIGAQLDILGKYVDAARNVLGVTIASTFYDWNTYDNVANTAHGMAYYTEDPTSDILTYLRYLERTYRISDTLLRQFIQFKAKSNKMNPTTKECDDLMYEFFGDSIRILLTGANMTIEYYFMGSDNLTLMQILDVSDSLPRPAGVAVSVTYV